jgi:MoxR-like ATPase
MSEPIFSTHTSTEANSSNTDLERLTAVIQEQSAFIVDLQREMQKVIIGQKDMQHKLLLALLCNGHILLEGVPGLAKTLAITALSKCVDVDFSRIQFTPDLLPADLIGTMIYDQQKGNFSVKKGPIFSNFVLADEINRAPAKVQSALLEAMQERQVTIGPETHKLPEPFLVLATQNPIEQEGTYPLPEAQVDRFMMKVVIGYPDRAEEQAIIRSNISAEAYPEPNKVIDPARVLAARKTVRQVYMDEKIEKYIVDIVFATREPSAVGMARLGDLISHGGSPRASISMAMAAKAHAFTQQRAFVIPEDVRSVCGDILRHRIGLTYEAEAENVSSDDIITELLNQVAVP